MREIVEWSGGASGNAKPEKLAQRNESAARHAMPRSESMPFEVADQQQPEVASRRPAPAGPSSRRRIVGTAPSTNPSKSCWSRI